MLSISDSFGPNLSALFVRCSGNTISQLLLPPGRSIWGPKASVGPWPEARPSSPVQGFATVPQAWNTGTDYTIDSIKPSQFYQRAISGPHHAIRSPPRHSPSFHGDDDMQLAYGDMRPQAATPGMPAGRPSQMWAEGGLRYKHSSYSANHIALVEIVLASASIRYAWNTVAQYETICIP